MSERRLGINSESETNSGYITCMKQLWSTATRGKIGWGETKEPLEVISLGEDREELKDSPISIARHR